MKEELISFETAKLANEKGFEPNIRVKKNSHYNSQTKVLDSLGISGSMLCDHYYAPTQSLLQKWLREEHRIIVLIRTPFEQLVKFGYIYNIEELHGISVNYNTEDNFYNTYEEALEFGLKKALELIK